VGYDFALGRGREGTVPVLEAMGSGMGFGVEAVEALEVEGSAVSSTRVRRALEGGDVETAARLLGRPYRMGGRVVPGRARGRTLGFPTANVAVPPGKLRPAHGVYAVRVHGVPGGPRGGVANLGVRPTFEEGGESLEIHLLDWDRNLLGVGLGVDLIARLRPERKFNSEMELRNQIEADAEAARQRLAPASGDGKG
jgi:riboflavin kinase/FMN adenylyltransferase